MAAIRPIDATDQVDNVQFQHLPSYANGEKLSESVTSDYALHGANTTTTWDSLEKPNSNIAPSYFDEESHAWNAPAETAKDLVTEVIHAQDDPTLNPWTFRMWFLGIGLSAFGGVLSTIYYFKPQTLAVSTIFLGCISYILGELMSHCIPRLGFIGRLLNPHSFNRKEHIAIMIMSSTASSAPLAMEVLSVTKLYYGKSINGFVGFLLIISTQCLGYGVAGMLRSVLMYPTKMLYPSTLPVASLLEVLHGEKSEVKKRLRVFYVGFTVLFFWEFFPQFIMPLLTGISIFCLTKRNSMVFTRLFGGSNGNEGLGFMSLCLDWQYVTGAPMWLPLQTLCNNLVGWMLCLLCFMGVYYGNVWRSKDFPFLTQLLYTKQSTAQKYVRFNQTQILDKNYEVDYTLLEKQGVPYFAGSFIVYLISTNVAITATFAHLLLFNYNDIKSAWSFASPKTVKRAFSLSNWKFWQKPSDTRDPNTSDPHVRLMLVYKDAPNWWYGMVFVLSMCLGLIATYLAQSTLPWWGFFVAVSLASICILFFGAQYAITGFHFGVQPVIQMLGGYLHPGRPVANMYFTLVGYNTVSQGQLLLRDLKLGQYVHLSPRCLFTVQVVGTFVGGGLSYAIMDTITTNQRDILLSIEGTNIWSGQVLQSYNSQAIAWGGLAAKLFSAGQRYQWVTFAFILGFFVPLPLWLLHKWKPRLRFDYWNTAIISYYIGWLCVGINSSILSFFLVGFFCQFWLRKYRPIFFKKYNYILSAAMDGGTQVLTFILTFALFGGAGKQVDFPPCWGNNFQKGNYDMCMKDPGSKGQ